VISKNYLSAELFLKLETVKLKSLVVADEYAAMNYNTNPAHTAHHTRRVYCLVKSYFFFSVVFNVLMTIACYAN